MSVFLSSTSFASPCQPALNLCVGMGVGGSFLPDASSPPL